MIFLKGLRQDDVTTSSGDAIVVYSMPIIAQLSLITAIIFNNGNYIELPASRAPKYAA